ncbi:hypothetical protein [Methanobrevibacter sp.]|uniref:hypothetical protein n=1 Tax=Methanobrevibacter sp. TaxID=66852 RepID=UPI00386A6A95
MSSVRNNGRTHLPSPDSEFLHIFKTEVNTFFNVTGKTRVRQKTFYSDNIY